MQESGRGGLVVAKAGVTLVVSMVETLVVKMVELVALCL